MTGHKRSHETFETDNNSVGATLARVRRGSTSASSSGYTSGERHEDWTTVGPRSKRRKKNKEKDKYPSISHSPNARLKTFVKIADLQNLVLYLLADGTAPQWCSVKQHNAIRKVVVLMVPGLETNMFNGNIALTSIGDGDALVEDHADSPGLADTQSKEVLCKDTQQVADTQSKEVLCEDTQQDAIAVPPTRKTTFSPDDYYPIKLVHDRLPAPLQPLAEVFRHIWPVKTPGEDKNGRMHSPLAAILTVPLVKTKEEKKAKGPSFPKEGKNWKNVRTPVTEMLATTSELAEQGYVLHPAHIAETSSPDDVRARRKADKTTEEYGWIDTPNMPTLATGQEAAEKDNEAGSVTAGRNVLVMDCEMCVTSQKGDPIVLALTRISIVDWDGKVVLDEYVKPSEPITDYVTQFSGITPEKLEGVTTTLADIQTKLKELFTPQAIVVGHSLESDFNALQMTHPYIIDTALLYPHPRGPPLKSSLKWLAKKYLTRDIQQGHGTSGHDSVEDARACLDLVKQKSEKGMSWGTSEASGEPLFKRLGRSKRPKSQAVVAGGENEYRNAAVVDWGDPSRGYGGNAAATVGCQSDAEVVQGIKRALNGDDDDDGSIPRGGCDLVWARMRELEAHRGWWNKSKVADTDTMRSNTVTDTAGSDLADMVSKTAHHIKRVHDELPPCTALIVYSGSGDPRELQELQDMQRTFKEEYRTKKWDQLSVQWTDTEEQRLRKACDKARMGCGFVTVK